MKIVGVSTAELRPVAVENDWAYESRIASPMTRYPEYAAARSSFMPRWPDHLVQVETDEGVIGVGCPVPAPAAAIIRDHLCRLIVGEDPFAVERLWDLMYRATMPYGRKGLVLMAISGVDIALWDVIGKALDQPVWRLLGGPTGIELDAYCTGNDIELNSRFGFSGYKLAVGYGPADGRAGIARNIAQVAEAREQLGPDVDLMLDCWMAWDVNYTLRMARLLEPYDIRWIEECLPPDDYEGYATLTEQVESTRIACGEHEYTRWGFKELLARRCCHIIQPDVAWTGGITESRKILALASAFGVEVVPHGGGVQPWALQLLAASPECSLAECVVRGAVDDVETAGRAYPYFVDLPTWNGQSIGPSHVAGVGTTVDESYLVEVVQGDVS